MPGEGIIQMSIHPFKEIVSPKELPSVTGLSIPTIWRLEKSGGFVPKIRLSAGRVGYRRSDIEAWLQSRTVSAEV